MMLMCMSLLYSQVCDRSTGNGTAMLPHTNCEANNPWCDTNGRCKCADAYHSGTTCDMRSNICGVIYNGTNVPPECRCGGTGTPADPGTIACSDVGTSPSCLTVFHAEGTHVVADNTSICYKCRKVADGGPGDGSAQDTCPDNHKCYMDGSCIGKI